MSCTSRAQPYERGFQHGKLLAAEIVEYIRSVATARSPKSPSEAWRDMRTLVNALFLRRYDAEYLQEMKGIADGAAAAGGKFDGRSIDLVDIVTLNSNIEVEMLDAGLDATATGLEGTDFNDPADGHEAGEQEDHCSAFAATGPATADGQIVFGHITMSGLPSVRHLQRLARHPAPRRPPRGVQTYPGGIMSGLDYYMNDAGLLCCETTIAQTELPRRRRSVGLAHSPCDAICRFDRQGHRNPAGREQRAVLERMAAGRHQDQRNRHVRAGHAQA